MIGQELTKTEDPINLDLTALLDIIFIVLVFLLLTANSQLLSLKVDIPQVDNSPISQIDNHDVISVNVLATAPHFAINGQTVADFSDLEKLFDQQYQPPMQVVIGADKQAPVQALMQLIAMLQRKQIQQSQILMKH